MMNEAYTIDDKSHSERSIESSIPASSYLTTQILPYNAAP